MSVVVPNTGAPGESRPRYRRVGPLGGATTGGAAGNGQPLAGNGMGNGEVVGLIGRDTPNGPPGPEWGDFLDAATRRGHSHGASAREPYLNGNGGPSPNGGSLAPGRHASGFDQRRSGPPPVQPDPPNSRQPYRGPGRGVGSLQPPHPGYLVDTPTVRYTSASLPFAPPQAPSRPRNGASIGHRPPGPEVGTAADAPTELIRRGAHSFAPHVPGQRPVPTVDPPLRRSAPVGAPGRSAELDDLAPSGPDRGRTTGGRRHHRAGSRPAAEFAATAPARKAKRGRRRRATFWKELPILIVVALVLTCLIQTFMARVYEIPSGSMETTLHGCDGCANDRVLVDKLSYHFGDASPGDVVVFAGPENWQDSDFRAHRSDNVLIRGLQSVGSLLGLAPPDEKDLIKRVIAVGGQTVACCDSRNRVTVNGKPLDEPYIYYLPEAGPPTQAEFGPVRVPEGQLWVMGDSRNNSADSRVPGHGPIPVDAVIGKARYVVLPFRRAQHIPNPNPQSTAQPQAAR